MLEEDEQVSAGRWNALSVIGLMRPAVVFVNGFDHDVNTWC